MHITSEDWQVSFCMLYKLFHFLNHLRERITPFIYYFAIFLPCEFEWREKKEKGSALPLIFFMTFQTTELRRYATLSYVSAFKKRWKLKT